MKTLKSLTALLAVVMVMFACRGIEQPVVKPNNSGKGTKESPYSVAGALKAATGKAFVQGYIVGFMQTGDENSPVFSASTDSIRTNILIADTIAGIKEYMAVQLPKGDVRDGLNLVDNKGMLNKKVVLYGEITNYFNQLGIRNTTWAEVDGKEFGEIPSANPDAIFVETFESSLGQFVEYSVAGDQKWAFDSHKYVMITGYVDQTNYANEDYLISPVISLPSEATKLTFEYVARYFNLLENQALVLVSTDYQEGDPSQANWNRLDCKLTSASDWTFAKSPEVDLSAYAGSQVRIALKYISTAEKAGTWEVKNFVVERGQAATTGPDTETKGSGTESDPYNCAAAIANQGAKGDGPLAFVEGVIVGCYNFDASNQYVFGADTINTNLLIADVAGAPAEYLAVQLPSGDVRTALNLKDHPENVGKRVLIYGNLETYCSKPGVKSVSYASIDGVGYGLKPGNHEGDIFYAPMTEGADGFTCVDIVKPSGISHIWAYDSKYKCAKATAYANGAKQDGESYWVSPAINLSKVSSATLTFQNAANYTANVQEELQLFYSTTSDGTSFASGWTRLPIDNLSSTGFNWVLSTVDLASVCGNANVRFAFRYKSTATMCGTWEIKEFVIK